VAVSIISPNIVFPFLKTVQFAFYVEQQDVTSANPLAKLATSVGVDEQRFLEVFRSDTAKRRTVDYFNKARGWGVHSFPAVVMQNAAGYSALVTGYHSFKEVCPKLDEWLET
jgi:putative protein-disulfide isomerase